LSPKPHANGQRKLWFFGCACCRRIWHLLEDERSRKGVKLVERLADGFASREEWGDAWQEANRAQAKAHDAVRDSLRSSGTFDETDLSAAAAAAHVLQPNGLTAAEGAAACASSTRGFPRVGPEGHGYDAPAAVAEREVQAALLRDVFGNPFRPVALNPAWRTPTVTALATAAYEERHLPAGTLDSDRLAILADALEDAGCENADILTHLRGPGPHVRGCWVIDLLLGKE
jgi:hypothetical protein